MESDKHLPAPPAKLDSQLAADCRRKKDRRSKKTNPLSPTSWQGHRSASRRTTDLAKSYFDRYHPSLLALCVTLLLLSCGDAFLTLRLMQHGAVEVNPIMRFFLEWNDSAFVIAKVTLSSFGIVLLAAHYHFKWIRIFRVSHILHMLIVGYLLLLSYELYLLFVVVP